jgi:hypothetical protein
MKPTPAQVRVRTNMSGGMDKARVQWVGKESFIAQSPSGHMVAPDSDRSTRGAPGPMELLLIALGARTATDMVSILAKKRQEHDSLEVDVRHTIGAFATRLDEARNCSQASRNAGADRDAARGSFKRRKILLGSGDAWQDCRYFVSI